MDFTQNKVSCIHIVYVEIFVLFLCRKKNNFRIPKRKAPGVRIKKAKYFNYKMLFVVGLVSVCYIKSQRIEMFTVFRCILKISWIVLLLNVQHGWGGVGWAKCSTYNVPGLGAVTKTCCLYIQLPLERMCCSISSVLASIYSEIYCWTNSFRYSVRFRASL